MLSFSREESVAGQLEVGEQQTENMERSPILQEIPFPDRVGWSSDPLKTSECSSLNPSQVNKSVNMHAPTHT